jgi:hypothetical protein
MRLAAALLAVCLPAMADHCPPGSRTGPLPGGHICSTPPEFFCATGYVKICTGGPTEISGCRCEPEQCEIRVIFRKAAPGEPWEVTETPGCSDADSELALATALAKRLGLKLR